MGKTIAGGGSGAAEWCNISLRLWKDSWPSNEQSKQQVQSCWLGGNRWWALLVKSGPLLGQLYDSLEGFVLDRGRWWSCLFPDEFSLGCRGLDARHQKVTLVLQWIKGMICGIAEELGPSNGRFQDVQNTVNGIQTTVVCNYGDLTQNESLKWPHPARLAKRLLAIIWPSAMELSWYCGKWTTCCNLSDHTCHMVVSYCELLWLKNNFCSQEDTGLELHVVSSRRGAMFSVSLIYSIDYHEMWAGMGAVVFKPLAGS